MNKILVCPVAFNENIKLKSVIERFLKSAIRQEADYLIVDDASNDGTTSLIEGFADSGVKTIRHERQRGVGAAIRTAIQYARKNKYEILVIMAGNDKDNPEEIPVLLKPIIEEGYDVVQGSRYKHASGAGGHMPYYRKIATKLHPLFLSMITGKAMTDSTNGFRAIRVALFDDKRINIDQPWLNGYELEPYILFKAIKLGYMVKEVPVTKIYPPKKLGYTKMRPILGWWSILKPLVYLGLGIRK